MARRREAVAAVARFAVRLWDVESHTRPERARRGCLRSRKGSAAQEVRHLSKSARSFPYATLASCPHSSHPSF